MRISVQGLQLRNKTFHFRRAVPPDLVETTRQREWKKSLGFKEHQRVAAAVQADALWRAADREIATLRRGLEHNVSPLELHTAAGRWAAQYGLLE